mmetsp:Transcript_27/g.139  ORF Transcript_27/g.139 Transcript_27/m.139 type:complete len:225 (-) Transcript_27:713-1387(-)
MTAKSKAVTVVVGTAAVSIRRATVLVGRRRRSSSVTILALVVAVTGGRRVVSQGAAVADVIVVASDLVIIQSTFSNSTSTGTLTVPTCRVIHKLGIVSGKWIIQQILGHFRGQGKGIHSRTHGQIHHVGYRLHTTAGARQDAQVAPLHRHSTTNTSIRDNLLHFQTLRHHILGNAAATRAGRRGTAGKARIHTHGASRSSVVGFNVLGSNRRRNQRLFDIVTGG